MKRQLPPLNSLRAFEAAARLASFTAAADELCVTHGAVSRHIAQLEDWLGKPLFQRLNRRVVLTDAGALYLAEVGAAFDRIALATKQQLERSAHRILRVNALTTFTLRWLIPRLSSFQLAHPAIEVRLTTSHQAIAALGDGFDVVIRGGTDAQAAQVAGYQAQQFLAEARLPVCSPALLARQPITQPSDLAQHTLLHTATLANVWPEWLIAAGVPELKPRQSLTLEHFYLTLQGALDGLGVAMGPLALVADDINEGRLVTPFAAPLLPAWRYFSYVPERQKDDPAVAAFCAWLQATGALS
ncbi:MAG: transcriptional regulator GcvA [Pseudomonadota bacterium]